VLQAPEQPALVSAFPEIQLEGEYMRKRRRADRPVSENDRGGDITVRLLASFKKSIAEGDYVPGSKLPPERELARQFRVNRSSLRQAIKVMQLLGVVSQRVGDGTYLNSDAASILREPIEFMILLGDIADGELAEARLIVEPELALRAAKRATDDDLAALRRAVRLMRRSTSAASRLEADLAFHEAIFKASGNRVCRLIFTMIQRALLLSMAKVVNQTSVDRPLRFHESIYAAISGRKPEEARQAMIDHIVDVWSQLRGSNVPGVFGRIDLSISRLPTSSRRASHTNPATA
jgi:GntR family transcriptional regulator, transcriptional repressor for pyruvate dehydrogenase complex